MWMEEEVRESLGEGHPAALEAGGQGCTRNGRGRGGSLPWRLQKEHSPANTFTLEHVPSREGRKKIHACPKLGAVCYSSSRELTPRSRQPGTGLGNYLLQEVRAQSNGRFHMAGAKPTAQGHPH